MRTLTTPRSAVKLAAGIAAGVAGATALASRRRRALGYHGPGPDGLGSGPRVLVLGAGFGGITTAIELGRLARTGTPMQIMLVDRVDFHLFTPMLYQVATGLVEPGHVEYPARAIARKYGFRFRTGQVERIDLDGRCVEVSGDRLPYDRLVIALGSVTNYFGNQSIERYAASLKTVGDAIAIRNRVVDAFERADVERDRAARRALLTFVIVGGGATGIELIGSLRTLVKHGLLPLYPAIDPSEIRIVLAEAGPALLNGMDPWLGETTRQRLSEKGIEVALGNPATEVSEDGIAFKDGSFIPSKTVVWAAGVRPSPVSAALEVERGRDGRLIVDRHLRLPAHPEVFALGDCAWYPIPAQDGSPPPPNAQTPVLQAPVVARNVAASLHGQPLEPFHYASEGNLVALGQGNGVALIGSKRLEGLPAWLVWRGYYLTQLMGFKNRLAVLVEWTSAYFGHRATPRLDVERSVPSPASRLRASRPADPVTAR
jgi:NADH dehydrogenase